METFIIDKITQYHSIAIAINNQIQIVVHKDILKLYSHIFMEGVQLSEHFIRRIRYLKNQERSVLYANV